MEVFQFSLFPGFITQKFRDANKPVHTIYSYTFSKAQFVFVPIKLEYNQDA